MGLTVVPGNMIEDGTITDSNFPNTEITSADMALDPRNASNISSGSVPLAQLGNVPVVGTGPLDNDLATLGFNIAATNSLAKYNLIQQTVDAFEDASGVDAGSSTGETRDASNYYAGTSTTTGPGDATGGTITYSGGNTIHSFTASGNFITESSNTLGSYLVVGGGGGGAKGLAGGGGGAGGYQAGSSFAVTAQTYAVGVGDGGLGGITDGAANTDGEDSTFSTITGNGGGKGGGGPGGSGGGGNFSQPGGTGSQGSNGGTGASTASYAGGGGGGATGSGGTGVGGSHGGDGGSGTANSITGSSVTYAGGGGGSNDNQAGATRAGYAGPGGGGAGEFVNVNGTAGTDGLGGGGGGGSGSYPTGRPGFDGGSGIVILSYTTDSFTNTTINYNNMTLVSTATTAQAVPTKGDMVMTYTNGAGTAVINTNIKGYVSRDGGTTYTQGTLATGNTIGGHIILSFHDLDISGQPSGSSMRYKIETLVQSAALTTRIQAVSLGWS